MGRERRGEMGREGGKGEGRGGEETREGEREEVGREGGERERR